MLEGFKKFFTHKVPAVIEKIGACLSPLGKKISPTFERICAKIGSKLKPALAGSLVVIGGISDGLQSVFSINQFFNLVWPIAFLGRLPFLVLAGVTRFILSFALEWPYVNQGLDKLAKLSQPKKFGLWCLSLLMNFPGALTAAFGTVDGFLAVFARNVLPLFIIVACVDAIQTLFTEGSFLKSFWKKMHGNSCAKKQGPQEEAAVEEEPYICKKSSSCAIWWLSLLLLGGPNAVSEAGIAALCWISLFSETSNTNWQYARYAGMVGKGLHNLALDGSSFSDLLARRIDGNSIWKHREISTARKALVGIVSILGVVVFGICGYVGMQQLTPSWVVLAYLAMVMKGLGSLAVEGLNFYLQLSKRANVLPTVGIENSVINVDVDERRHLLAIRD